MPSKAGGLQQDMKHTPEFTRSDEARQKHSGNKYMAAGLPNGLRASAACNRDISIGMSCSRSIGVDRWS
jgi:hypothetical protein